MGFSTTGATSPSVSVGRYWLPSVASRLKREARHAGLCRQAGPPGGFRRSRPSGVRRLVAHPLGPVLPMKSRERSWRGAGLESVYRAQPSPGCRCSRVGQSSPSLARLDLGPAISASGRIAHAMDPGVFDSAGAPHHLAPAPDRLLRRVPEDFGRPPVAPHLSVAPGRLTGTHPPRLTRGVPMTRLLFLTGMIALLVTGC